MSCTRRYIMYPIQSITFNLFKCGQLNTYGRLSVVSRPTGERGRVDAGRKTGHVGDNPWYVVHYLGAETATLPTHQAGPVLIRIVYIDSAGRSLDTPITRPNTHPPLNSTAKGQHTYSVLHVGTGQCCQLFEELFGQSRRKIRPLRKKFRSPSNFHFWKFGPFIGQNLAAYLSCRSTSFQPFLIYAAGNSASWQHCGISRQLIA
jgi:hypothetical protein